MGAVLRKSNLLGGVSQQPDPVKLPGQVREAQNVYLDPTFVSGLPPSSSVSSLPTSCRYPLVPDLRDAGERYAVALYKDGSGDTQVRVWDMLDGTERTVTLGDTATAYLSPKTSTQLTG